MKEGYLSKTGPKPSDGFKKRWFTLDGRKLMYHEQPMVCDLLINYEFLEIYLKLIMIKSMKNINF